MPADTVATDQATIAVPEQHAARFERAALDVDPARGRLGAELAAWLQLIDELAADTTPGRTA